MNLEVSARSWLEETAQRDSACYKPAWDVSRCGQTFPLFQHMAIETNHTILSVKTGLGKVGVGSEFCFFTVCPQLDATGLENACTLLGSLAEDCIDCGQRSHDYTFVSLVLLTGGGIDRSLQKQLKRYRNFQQYRRSEGQYGWSSCRLCVVDLHSGALYGSALAEPLLTRLSGGIPPTQPSLLERLRSFQDR